MVVDEWIDVESLSATLSRFLPHAKASALALTGGVAIQIHCRDAGVSCGRTRIADVDFVATDVDAVAPSVATSLLVAHFHLPHAGYPKFMMQLVDPATRLRIDVFPDLVASMTRATERRVAGHWVRVLDVRSILDHKMQTLARASATRPIDGKHERDARILAALCGQRIEPIRSDCIAPDVYGMDLTTCVRCDASRTSAFPVASRKRIFEILGYN